MLDYVVRNAGLHGETGLLDIAIQGGKIANIAASIVSEAPSFNAGGNLLTGGFVESHLHLDKACILDRAKNESGTLQGAISAVAKAKSGFTEDDVYARGAKVIEKAITQGTNAIRTHVEIDPGIGLAGFRAIKRLKHDYAWAMDIEICVFPQEGLLNYPGTEELLREALDNGADLLGGAPIWIAIRSGRSNACLKWRAITMSIWISIWISTSTRHGDIWMKSRVRRLPLAGKGV